MPDHFLCFGVESFHFVDDEQVDDVIAAVDTPGVIIMLV